MKAKKKPKADWLNSFWLPYLAGVMSSLTILIILTIVR